MKNDNDKKFEWIMIRRADAEAILTKMEDDWYFIENEWGTTPGGLDGAIKEGNQPEIALLRSILNDN